MLSGLNEQLPSNHPILVLYSRTLNVTHHQQEDAIKNYLAQIGRVFKYSQEWHIKNFGVPEHWSSLLIHKAPVVEFLEK